jgi:N-sulfoglucosamine sulfohydrolase
MRPPHALLVLLALCGVLAAAPPLRAQARQKNVVLIVADDHGRDLGCYGNRVIKTPNLDRLAAEGTRFENAFCTTASCSPSRSVLLSGLHTHTNGTYGLQHATHKQTSYEWVRSLPVLLERAGYRTASVAKVHVGPEPVYHFQSYLNQGIAGGRNTVGMAENAAAWLKAEPEKPFFLYFCPTDPHRPFGNRQAYPGVTETKYDPSTIPVPHHLPDQPEVRRELAEYYQSISRVDQGVGHLLEALRDAGRLDDTLVIYTSDNGMPFPGAKTNLYEPGLRLPLLVRKPDQPRRGLVSDAMVSWVDLLPAILEWTGVKGPDYPLQGRSFLPAVEGKPLAGPDEVYGSHQFHEITMYYPMRMVRTRRHKLIWNIAHPLPFPFAQDLFESPTWQGVLRRKDRMYGSRTVEAYVHRPEWELYDLEADPKELNNLAGKPDHSKSLADLKGKLRAWQESTRDPWLVKYEHE